MIITPITLVSLVAFSLFMANLLDAIHHKIERSTASQAFYKKAVDEIIILGFISFALLLGLDFQLIPKGYLLLVFELAHMILFIFGMSLVITNFAGYGQTKKCITTWREIEKGHFEVRGCCKLPSCLSFLADPIDLQYEREFAALKYIFMTSQGLSDSNFRYCNFLLANFTSILVEGLEEVSYDSWGLLFLIIFCYILIITSLPSQFLELLFGFVFAWSLVIISIWLMRSSVNGRKFIIEKCLFEENTDVENNHAKKKKKRNYQ